MDSKELPTSDPNWHPNRPDLSASTSTSSYNPHDPVDVIRRNMVIFNKPDVRYYLIKSHVGIKWFDNIGQPKAKCPLIHPKFNIEATNPTLCLWTRITARSEINFIGVMDQILENALITDRRHSLFHDPDYPEVEWRTIGPLHCKICYIKNHPANTCTNCGYCLEFGHRKIHCPKLHPELQEPEPLDRISRSSHPSDRPANWDSLSRGEKEKWRKKQQRKESRTAQHSQLHVAPGATSLDYTEEYAKLLVPFGHDGRERETIAIRISSIRLVSKKGAGNIAIAAWCGSRRGGNIIYVEQVLHEQLDTLATPATGFHPTDIVTAKPVEEITPKLISILSNRRVVVFGTTWLNSLGITTEVITQNNMEIIDINHRLGGRDKAYFHFDTLTKFIWGEKNVFDHWKKNLVLQGPSTKNEALSLLYSYVKISNGFHQLRMIPSFKDITTAVRENKTFKDWKACKESMTSSPSKKLKSS